ncbi:MAG: glycosyltransferase family 2 protein [Chloroflexi bacterium]|nr:glycosyltransferase family 2 protein [Chloroflexota bacterium]
MKLSIVMPAYNEERTIGQVLDAIARLDLKARLGVDLEREVLVVDDASTDGTRDVLARYAACPDIRVLRHDRNRGKGAALRTAFAALSGDIVLIQDADFEYDPAEYPALLEPIVSGRADVVYGSRLSGGRPQRVYMFWHLVGNRFLSLLTNALFNSTLSDMETGYKVFRREVVDGFRLRENDFRIEPEMTAQVLRNPRLRVYELPIAYYGRTYEEGKKITWKDGFKAVGTLLRCRFDL